MDSVVIKKMAGRNMREAAFEYGKHARHVAERALEKSLDLSFDVGRAYSAVGEEGRVVRYDLSEVLSDIWIGKNATE